MKIQFRYRSMVLAALAISLLAIAGFPQTAWAGNWNGNSKAAQAEERRSANANANANGGQGAAKNADVSASSSTSPSPAANNVDNQAGPTTHGSTSGPGGQTCDGDPDTPTDPNNNYENTCSSYPDPNNQGSDNGAGDGKATGKPCEGCVGNADDKNPPGQASSGPEDHNNGYECDQRGRSDKEGNNGVGFGNPAHTGCETSTENPCVPDPATQNPDCTPLCVPNRATQNADCTPKCVPNPATQNADCTPKCVPNPATQNADCSPKCVPTGTQDSSCKEKTCPAGQVMGSDGTCSTPCVANVDAACSQATPTCVESATVRCGAVAAAVLGETLGRLDVLGVSIEAPAAAAAVAPAALARTGGFQLTAMVQAGIVLAMVGLGLTVMGRRRRSTVELASRIDD